YGEDQLLRPKSVGRPVPGIEVCIKDNQESGELLIRSGLPGEHTVMLGYYKDPQATAAALVDGWFHTGDAGYFDEDGYLYISDRVKDMVITGGLNVASREVEEALLKHPGVYDAAVIGVPDRLWGEAIKAFVVANNGQWLSAEELQNFCGERLSGYKKPKYIQFVDDLPRGPTGKVLKHVLRDMSNSSNINPEARGRIKGNH
ncbi:MAG: AMP-binding protein, partial [Firmicutes bacterium]|nr:AMP-binding protein [Bacillota bacterium]